MKKSLSILLAIAIAMSANAVVYAQFPGPSNSQDGGAVTDAQVVTPYAITQTVSGGGAPTSGTKTTVNVGDIVNVVFLKSAFQWSTDGSGTYSFAQFNNAWIKISDAAFTLVGTVPNAETGSLTVQLKAAKAYEGTLSVYLDSAAGNANIASASAAWSAKMTVKDPVAEAAEKKRLEDEAAEKQRLANEAAEQQRLANEAAEQQRLANEAAEQQRLANEAAEQQRLANEAAERQRLADEASQAAERQRLADEASQAAEKQRLADEASQAAEKQRLADEASQAAAQSQSQSESSSSASQSSAPSTDGLRIGNQAMDRVMKGTQSGGNEPVILTSGDKFNVGESIQVKFDNTAFEWDGASGNYTMTAFKQDWVKYSTSPTGAPFTVTSAVPNPSDGSVTATLEATAVYSGSVSFYLQGDIGSGGASKAVSKSLEVVLADAAIERTRSGGNAPSASPNGGKIKEGDKIEFVFASDSFDWTGNGKKLAGSKVNAGWVKLVGATSGTDFDVSVTGVNDSVKVVLTAKKSGEYKNVQVSLLGGTGGTATTASAPMNITVQSTADSKITKTKSGGTAPTASHSGSPSININDKLTFTFPANNFEWDGATGKQLGSSMTNKGWIKLSGASLNGDFSATIERSDDANVRISLTALRSGTFNNLSVRLQSAGTDPSTTASAAMNVTVNPTGESKIIKTKSGGTAPTASHTGNPTVNAGDKLIFTFPANNFEWDTSTGKQVGSSLTDTSWISMTGASIGRDFLASIESSTDSSVRVALTPVNSGTYRKVSVYLQGGGGTATTATALMDITVNSVDTGKIDGISGGALLGGTYSGAYLNGKAISYSDLNDLEVKGDDELLLPLYAGFFTWSGTAPHPSSSITKSQLNGGKITVSATNRSGSRALSTSEPKLVSDKGTMCVQVKFASDYTSTRDIDFEMTLTLAVDRKRDSASALYLAGSLVREIYEIWDDDSYVDLSDGIIAETSAYIRNAELYLGEGVTAFASLSANRKYSGVATTDMSSYDEDLFRKHPDLEQVYTLKTSGLGTNCKITLDVGGEYFVYDEKLDYIGKSDEKLPFSHKYYLAAKKIDFDNDDDFDEIDDDDDDDEPIVYPTPSTSKDTTATNNFNANPRTGR